MMQNKVESLLKNRFVGTRGVASDLLLGERGLGKTSTLIDIVDAINS